MIMSTHQHEFSGQVNWGMEDVVGFSASALPSACDSLPTTGIPGQILSHASAKPVSQSSFGFGGREMYSKEQWEIQKPVIYRLYNQENKSFKRVVEILRSEHNFFPTRRQFYRKISEWGFEKNIKESEMRAIAQNLEQGEMDGPAELKGRQIDTAKILRWQKRQGRLKSALHSFTNIAVDLPVKDSLHVTNEIEPSLPTAENSMPILVSSTPVSPMGTMETSHSSNIWATVDVPGSPLLSRLFNALQIECHGEIPAISIGSPIAASAEPYIAETEIEDISIEEQPENAAEKDETGTTSLSSCSSVLNLRENQPWRQPECNLLNESFDEWAFSRWDFSKGEPLHREIKMGPGKPISPFPISYTTITRGTSTIQRPVLCQWQKLETDETVYKNRLRILKKSFSEDDPRIIKAMSDLAYIYGLQCKDRQSERLSRHVAISLRRIHGFKHRETLSAYLDVVYNLIDQGKHRLAAKIQQQVHATILNHIGTEDNLSLRSTIAWSYIYRGLSENEEADTIFRQILQRRLNTLGPRHRKTLDVMGRFASFLRYSGNLIEVEKLLSSVFQLQHEAEGTEWQDISYNELDLAKLLMARGRYREGKTLALKAAEVLEFFLGPDHQDTFRCYTAVARCLYKLGQYAESESKLQEMLERQVKRRGESHIQTTYTTFFLGLVLEKTGRSQEAVGYYETCLRVRVENLGLENPDVIKTCDRLGRCYESLGRYEDAFDLYQRTVDQLRSTNTDEHPAVVKIRSWIAELRALLAARKDTVCYEQDDYHKPDEVDFDMISDEKANSEGEEETTGQEGDAISEEWMSTFVDLQSPGVDEKEEVYPDGQT